MSAAWRLDKVEIAFKKGYQFERNPAHKADRYEGSLAFSNGDGDSFTLAADSRLSLRLLEVCASVVEESAVELAKKVGDSMRAQIEAGAEATEKTG